MAVLKSDKDKNNITDSLFKNYDWFYTNIFSCTQKALDNFFKKDFKLRFLGVFKDKENILFYGDEYFVNKTDINKYSSIIIRISSSLVASILDNTFGKREEKFSLKNLTHIEAEILKAFTAYICQNFEPYIDKNEVNKSLMKSSKDYHFSFYARYEKEHSGKIIITVPEYIIKGIKSKVCNERFSISDFKDTKVSVNIGAGLTKVPLNDIKNIEEGDIILLEESNIKEMFVLLDEKKYKFTINPNPSLIISIDKNGGNEMEEETSVKPQNMWDSILVDVVAEFDNVKLTLGELKQISEGLVIDVGSVYDNKIKLRVENQVVAIGELVILNDRYGVRIDSIKKTKEEVKKPAQKPAANADKKAEAKTEAAEKKAPVKQAAKPAESNDNSADEKENFDYSDFEIEDESI